MGLITTPGHSRCGSLTIQIVMRFALTATSSLHVAQCYFRYHYRFALPPSGFVAVPPLIKRNVIPLSLCARGISRTSGVVAYFGLVMSVIGFTSDNFDNPYLTVHAAQPIWTVLVPLIWITVFRSAKNFPHQCIDAIGLTERNSAT